MAGFSRESILYRDRFSANLTEIGQYSSTLTQNIPVFREPKPETGSIALSAGQNGDKFPSQLRLLISTPKCPLLTQTIGKAAAHHRGLLPYCASSFALRLKCKGLAP
jgi:hypothetical protein